MFGMEYIIAFVHVLFRVGMGVVWAIPVSFIWNRISVVYFSFLDERWLQIPYWHIVGLYVLIEFVGGLIKTLVPTVIKVNNSSNNN